MSLNTDITQIVDFRTQSHSRTQYVFKYGDYNIKFTPLYQHLRIGFKLAFRLPIDGQGGGKIS